MACCKVPNNLMLPAVCCMTTYWIVIDLLAGMYTGLMLECELQEHFWYNWEEQELLLIFFCWTNLLQMWLLDWLYCDCIVTVLSLQMWLLDWLYCHWLLLFMPTDSVVSYPPGRKFIQDVSNRNVLNIFQNADEVILCLRLTQHWYLGSKSMQLWKL